MRTTLAIGVLVSSVLVQNGCVGRDKPGEADVNPNSPTKAGQLDSGVPGTVPPATEKSPEPGACVSGFQYSNGPPYRDLLPLLASQDTLCVAKTNAVSENAAHGLVLYTYVPVEHLLVVEHGDGRTDVDSRAVYRFTSEGVLGVLEFDEGADGKSNSIERHLYDCKGNKIREEHDRDADGTTDAIWSGNYGPGGRILKEQFAEVADSALGWVKTHEYDERGCLISDIETSRQGSDQATKVLYETDSQCRVLTSSQDLAGYDMRLEKRYTFDKSGRKIAEVWTRKPDGYVSKKAEWKYNDRGKLVEELVCDGMWKRTHFIYSEGGTIMGWSVSLAQTSKCQPVRSGWQKFADTELSPQCAEVLPDFAMDILLEQAAVEIGGIPVDGE